MTLVVLPVAQAAAVAAADLQVLQLVPVAVAVAKVAAAVAPAISGAVVMSVAAAVAAAKGTVLPVAAHTEAME